ncbi:MAG: Metal dependent phosphohydrolase, region [Rhizobium sp.]|nr:Metal dependent phosphohydrolase, region [Rhizobium sp.]
MQNDLLRHAEDIAVSAHAGQTEKTGRPFTDHLRRVVEKVGGREQKMVAYLHDIVEKADGWSVERLAREGFPPSVVDAVDAMTRRDGEDYAVFVRRAIADPLARPVKRADLEDNLQQAEQSGCDDSQYRLGLELLKETAGVE